MLANVHGQLATVLKGDILHAARRAPRAPMDGHGDEVQPADARFSPFGGSPASTPIPSAKPQSSSTDSAEDVNPAASIASRRCETH